MRKFFSYGTPNKTLHYYAPRTALIEQLCNQLLGENPQQDGHYMTVWAARQTGKTWVMQEAMFQLRRQQPDFDIAKLNLQDLEDQDVEGVYRGVIHKLGRELNRELPVPSDQQAFAESFSKAVLKKPLLLILDEFDALSANAIQSVVSVLRNIYNDRRQQIDKLSAEKEYLLHGVALIGVRSVLGVENTSGSPFNIQRSVRIPNLTQDEVTALFQWYEQESGQQFAPSLIERIIYEMQGQPGLTCWLGELLSETYNRHDAHITLRDFEIAYAAALDGLPNNNILNIVSKAKEEASRPLVLELFKTEAKLPFRYDDPQTNYLYLNGVVEQEIVDETKRYLKFSSPFVQKRLFNYFAHQLFPNLSQLYNPFDDLSDTITDTQLYIPNLMQRYEAYLKLNRHWIFKNAPRRKTDDRIYEAIYHFHLYMYLTQFLASYEGRVVPEFPTGNGQIDLFLEYAGVTYGLEIKSLVNQHEYQKALRQSARYGKKLGLSTMWLILFVESVTDENRQKFSTPYLDATTGVTVRPLLVVVGS